MNKRITDYTKNLPVLEVYRCVQSEGSRFGRPTIAVRTTGCTHRCYFEKVVGVTVGTLPYIQKGDNSVSTTLSRYMMKILISKK